MEGETTMNERFFTKSHFKLARECPAKLYYAGKPNEYANHKQEDPFLLALAEGGFQVGELAKYYIPGGVEIKTLDYEQSVKETNEYLKKDNIAIYEAAFKYQSLYIRADIIIKRGNQIELVEVKAKSVDSSNPAFRSRNGIKSEWKPYIEDIAFQKYVISSAFPEYTVVPFLMLADKNAICPTDGLNQKFMIRKTQEGRKYVTVSKNINDEDLSRQILTKISVDDLCEEIYQKTYELNGKELSFFELINTYAKYYSKDMKLSSQPSPICKECEFFTTSEEKTRNIKSGFEECWKEALNWTDNDFNEQTVLDIWNFRKKNDLINDGKIKLSQLVETDISPRPDSKQGLSISQRQWLQVEKAKNNDLSAWVDKENLYEVMNKWIYPLHFIDFETTSVAIPFNKGRHPYEGIAFQFSHHIAYQDGRIEHIGQYLNTERGVFPNYDFVRALKRQLEQDEGSIFRYAAHENTYLNIIYNQLIEDNGDIPDKQDLCSFIQSISQSASSSMHQWVGRRNMIDMCDLVKRYYYNPAMKGSNSIKKVLPSLINSSEFLKNKYSKPIYGAVGGIPSLNYKDWRWIEYEEGRIKDPYKLLPKMFKDIKDDDIELFSDDEIREGGAALAAYARMQFEEMSEYERNEICKALLKYCELDTFAMVMIYEGWKDLIKY